MYLLVFYAKYMSVYKKVIFFLGDFLTGGFPVVDLSQYLENSNRFISSFFYKPNQWSVLEAAPTLAGNLI